MLPFHTQQINSLYSCRFLVMWAAWLYGWHLQSGHCFGPDWNTPTTIGCTMIFGKDIHGPQGINSNDYNLNLTQLHFETKASFTLHTKWQLLTSGFFLQWERVQSTFFPRSNDTGVTGIYRLQLWLAVMETWHLGGPANFCPFSDAMLWCMLKFPPLRCVNSKEHCLLF